MQDHKHETAAPPCPGCSDLKGTKEDRYVDVADVIRAKEQDCAGCEIINWVLEPFMDQITNQGYEVRLYFNSGAWINYVFNRHDSSTRRNFILGHSLEISGVPKRTPCLSVFDAELQDACPWPDLQAAPMISGYTGSAEAIARAKSWLDECSTLHTGCGQATEPQLPTRVLKLVGVNEVRLHETNNETGEYACLSHCWGKRHIIHTTSSTLSKHVAGIPWDELPQTFQDAVIFAYSLGLEYLWIDSLCILQDSVEDWRREGSKMATIYESSYVTLAATKSSDSSQGCFAHSQPAKVSRTKTFRNKANEPYDVHCREVLSLCIDIPLQTRGWVLQERLLPKRIVHFVDEELYWECNQLSTCECSASSRSHQLPGPESRSSIRGKSKWDVRKEMQDAQSVHEIGKLWAQFVEEYTTRALTYATDIFPAVQGLAKVVSPIMGRYLAGHWEVTLPQSLAWYIDPDALGRSGPSSSAQWRAPSWSWAAAMSPVQWGRNGDSLLPSNRMFATLVSARIVPKGTDPTGELSDGDLALKGNCLTAMVAKGEYSDPKLCILENDTENAGHQKQTDPWWCYPCWDSVVKPKSGTQVMVIRLSETEQQEKEYWMVLESVDSHPKTYKRIGLMVLDSYYHLDLDIPFILSKERLAELYEKEGKETEVTII